jgi:DNA repair exonuclease SbcCD nuclease subunit
MRQLKLIHTGDWHVFANTSWQSSGFFHHHQSLKQCISRIFHASRFADFLLITGDIIERHPPVECKKYCEKYLDWIEKNIVALGKEKVIVAYGSHDKEEFGRKWLDLRTAPRTCLSGNVYMVENSRLNIVFYCVDSPIEGSKKQELSKDAVNTIKNARTGRHKFFKHSVLLMQLQKKNLNQIVSLADYIDYIALGDQHNVEILSNKPRSAYSGAPISRDGCTLGDTGPRYFLKVRIIGDDVQIKKATLPEGIYQVKVRGPERGAATAAIESAPNRYEITHKWTSRQIVDKIEEITAGAWTRVAIAESIHNQQEVIDELQHRFGDSMVWSYRTTNEIYYFFRKIQRA